MNPSIAEKEIQRIQWDHLRVAGGTGESLPSTLTSLLDARNSEEAEAAYWGLENFVVVQGQLYSAAPSVVSVVLAALCDDRSRETKIDLLELLFQIVSGESHESERALGNGDLGSQCRDRAREGLWILYREFAHGGFAGAFEVLDKVENDRARLTMFESSSK